MRGRGGGGGGGPKGPNQPGAKPGHAQMRQRQPKQFLFTETKTRQFNKTKISTKPETCGQCHVLSMKQRRSRGQKGWQKMMRGPLLGQRLRESETEPDSEKTKRPVFTTASEQLSSRPSTPPNQLNQVQQHESDSTPPTHNQKPRENPA
jgi:hypothetical protein